MTPTVIEQSDTFKDYSRPPVCPSLRCNIFGCRQDYIEVDEHNSYFECKRCGERIGYSTFKIELEM